MLEDFSRRRRDEIYEGLVLTSSFSRQIRDLFSQATTTTATRTPINKRFYEQNNAARALKIFVHFFAVLFKTTTWNDQVLSILNYVERDGQIFYIDANLISDKDFIIFYELFSSRNPDFAYDAYNRST